MNNTELYIKLINEFKNKHSFNDMMVDSPTSAMNILQCFNEGIIAGITLAHNIENNIETP